MSYLMRFARRPARNSAGGFAWAVDDWTRLRRFLILGSEGGSFYAGERTLTRENATAVWRCVEADGARARARDRRGQHGGSRAPRTTRRSSRSRWRPRPPRTRPARPRSPRCREVCRTGTHLFAFAALRRGLPRLGPLAAPRRSRRGTRPARPDELAYQAVKYRRATA